MPGFLTPSSIQAVPAMLAAISMKTLALVLLGILAAWALRRSSAACRHALWTAVLVGVFVIAIAEPFPPTWSIRLTSVPADLEQDLPIDAAPPAAPGFETVHPIRATAPARARGWAGSALVLLWVAGVAFFVLRIGAAQLGLRRIVARSRAIVSGPARDLLEELTGRPPVMSRVRLIESDVIHVPATWGALRPVIALPALPAAARVWPAPRLEAALRHELAHVRRGDALTQMGAELCCALLWFHPAVWFAARRMRWERERACDDAVVSAGGAGVDYAEWLLIMAKELSLRGRGSIPAGVAMAEAERLEQRLRAILDPAMPRSSPRAVMVSLAAGALFTTVAMAGLEIRASANPAVAGIPVGERVPLSPEAELRALERSFRPRDEREALAIARLREAAQHEPRHALDLVRERAVWALSVAREDEAVSPLVAELANADWRIRAYAAWCLGVVGPAAAREALTAKLRDPVWRVREMAAAALAGLADPRSAEEMLPLLSDPAWQVRLAAVEYLGRLLTPEALAAVKDRTRDAHVAVRSAALDALEKPGNP